MQFNKRVDLVTNPAIDTSYFNTLLEGIGGDQLYVTFVAVNDGDTTEVWQEQEESFLWLVLPYDRIVTEDPIPIMKQYLLESLLLLHWLDVESLQGQVAQKIAA